MQRRLRYVGAMIETASWASAMHHEAVMDQARRAARSGVEWALCGAALGIAIGFSLSAGTILLDRMQSSPEREFVADADELALPPVSARARSMRGGEDWSESAVPPAAGVEAPPSADIVPAPLRSAPSAGAAPSSEQPRRARDASPLLPVLILIGTGGLGSGESLRYRMP